MVTTVSIGTVWRTIIEASVPGITYGNPITINTTKETYIPLIFNGNHFISYLLSTGCIQHRSQGVEWGEALRARDIIRPLTNEYRFADNTNKWVCRSNEPVSSLYSFSVSALLNSTNFVLAAPFLKQGTLFLNPRFFLLDRTTARLYVFTYDYSTSPRYYVDFVTQPCTVTLIQPTTVTTTTITTASNSVSTIRNDDDSDSDTEEENDNVPYPSSTPTTIPPSSTPSLSPVWLPQGTGTTTLPAGKTKSWGFIINGPSLRIVAYTDRERRARVWVKGITATINRSAPRPIVSHSQQRLRKINIAPPYYLLPGHNEDDDTNLPSLSRNGATLESPLFTPYLPSAIATTAQHIHRQHPLSSYASSSSSSSTDASTDTDATKKPQTPLLKHLQSMRNFVNQQQQHIYDEYTDGGSSIPSSLVPRSIQDLLAIPHDTLRKYTKSDWITNYVNDLSRNQAKPVLESEEDTMNNGKQVPSNTMQTPQKNKDTSISTNGTDPMTTDKPIFFHRTLPSWTTITETTLVTLCHPPAMVELYTTALEIYTKCINESLGLLLPSTETLTTGTDNEENNDGTNLSYGYPNSNGTPNDTIDLRALRLLVLEPWRLVSDLGIFIPAHQRYIIERCATFIDRLPEETLNDELSVPLSDKVDNDSSVGTIVPTDSTVPLKPVLLKHYRMSARLSTYLDPSALSSVSSTSSSASSSFSRPVSLSRLHKPDPLPAYANPGIPDDSTIFDAQRALVQLQIASAFSAYTAHMERAGEVAGADALAAEFALSLVPRQPSTVGDGKQALLTRADHHTSSLRINGEETTLTNGLETISETQIYEDGNPNTGSTRASSSTTPLTITSAIALDVATCEAWAILLSRVAATVHDVFRVPRKLPSSMLHGTPSNDGSTLSTLNPSHRTPQKADIPLPRGKVSLASSIGRRSFAREESFFSTSSPFSNDTMTNDYRRESANSIELASALAAWGKIDRGIPRRRASSGDRYVYGTALPTLTNFSLSKSPSTIVSGRRNSDSDIGKERSYGNLRDINALLDGLDSSSTSNLAINDNSERLSVADLLELSSPPQSPETRRTMPGKSPRPVTHSGFHRRENSVTGITTSSPSHPNTVSVSKSNPTTSSGGKATANSSSSFSSAAPPFNDALLRKILELTNQRLKSLMVTFAVDILTSGRHPSSVLLQRIIASLQSLYGTEVFMRFGINTNDAIRYLRTDLGPAITRTAKQLRDWPKLWLAALNDWGATALYLRPSYTFERIFQQQAIYENLHSNDWDIGMNRSGYASSDPVAASTSSSFGTPLGSPPPFLASTASPATTAPSTEVRTAWRYACRITKSLHLSERDIDDICTDAIQTVVFRVLGKSIHALYRSVHVQEDTALRQAYAILWGMTTTQQDLADELRLDALSHCLPLHSFTHLSTRCSYILPAAQGSHEYMEQQVQRQQSIFGYDINTNVQQIPIITTTSCLPTQALAVLWTSMAISLRLPLGLLPAAVLGKSVTNSNSSTSSGAANTDNSMYSSSSSATDRNRSRSNSHTNTGNTNSVKYNEYWKQHQQYQEDVQLLVQNMERVQTWQPVNPSLKEFAVLNSNDTDSNPTKFAFPEYNKGTIDNPASLVALQPAIAIFSLFAQYQEPNMKLRVLMATVDTLCRCVTAHRTGIAASIAHIRKVNREHSEVSVNGEGNPEALISSASSVVQKPVTTAELIAASLAATNVASLLETAHINADDLLGLLCHIAIHAGVPNLISDIAMVADYVSEEMMIERPGFFLTSLQAAVAYAVTDDIQQRLACGHCEGKSKLPVSVRCRSCGRQLCSVCDALLHTPLTTPGRVKESAATDEQNPTMKTHVRTPAPITILSSLSSSPLSKHTAEFTPLISPSPHHRHHHIIAKLQQRLRHGKHISSSAIESSRLHRRRIIGSTSDMDPDSQRILTSLHPIVPLPNGTLSSSSTSSRTLEPLRPRTVSTSALVWPSVTVSLNDGTLEGVSKDELYHWWSTSQNIPSNSPTEPKGELASMGNYPPTTAVHNPQEPNNTTDKENNVSVLSSLPNSVGYATLAATANEILTSPRTSRYRSTSALPHNTLEEED